jgi:hypothetical protein
MPCQDGKDIKVSSQYASSFQAQTGETEHCNQEACPPFCTCTCCSLLRHFITGSTYAFVKEDTAGSYSEYNMPAIREQAIAIWQPPQLA